MNSSSTINGALPQTSATILKMNHSLFVILNDLPSFFLERKVSKIFNWKVKTEMILFSFSYLLDEPTILSKCCYIFNSILHFLSRTALIFHHALVAMNSNYEAVLSFSIFFLCSQTNIHYVSKAKYFDDIFMKKPSSEYHVTVHSHF